MNRLIVIASVLVLFTACNGGDKKSSSDINVEDVKGKWALTNFEDPEGKYSFEITECDKLTVWEFSDIKAESLDDETETFQLIVTSPDTCKWFDFESKWALTNGGDLFISSMRVGGLGGMSPAGKFDIIEFSDSKMGLEMMDCFYTFKRI